MIIPMDTPQAASGPMTRARARAIETQVTSLLNDYSFDTNETRVLPQAETLCMLRYHDQGHQDTMGMDSKTTEQEDQRKDKSSRAQNFRPMCCSATVDLDNFLSSPEPARNLWPPELAAPGTSGLPGTSGPYSASATRPATSLGKPRNQPEISRNFRPTYAQSLGPECPCTPSASFFYLDYKYSSPTFVLGLANV